MATELKMERIRQNIPQFRLAQLAGISQTELSTYELGRRRCNAEKRRAIADALKVRPEQIFPARFDEEAEQLRKHGDIW